MEKTPIQDIICRIAELEAQTEETDGVPGAREQLLQTLYDAVKAAPELYLAVNRQTGYPHVDDEGCIWIFSSKEYADIAADYFMQQMILLEMRRIAQEEITNLLVRLHTWGMERVRIDNGQCTIAIERGKLLPPPDWSQTPADQIPVTNPTLERKMIVFFQNLRSRVGGPDKKEYLHRLEAEMLAEVLKGRFIVPAQGTMFANLNDNADGSNWLPAFTGWEEFAKVYDPRQWNGSVLPYTQLLTAAGNRGIVIDPMGVNFRITEQNKRAIAQFAQELETSDAQPQQSEPAVQPQQPEPAVQPQQPEPVVQPQPGVLIPRWIRDSSIGEFVPTAMTAYPGALVNAMKMYMKQKPEIRRGYIVQTMFRQSAAYMVVVDFLGSPQQIFGELSSVAEPYLGGIELYFHEADAWGLGLVKSNKPFYKKGFWG